jgi:pimeloyl-ACP methyl ester carboxylesterase
MRRLLAMFAGAMFAGMAGFAFAAPAAADEPAAVSRIAAAPCAVPLDPARFQCGTLIAPMTRKPGDARVVRLPFAIYKPFPATSKRSAITLLAGGPGFTTVGSAGPIGPTFEPLGRDVVFLERRGTGFAEPSLACPSGTRRSDHDWDLAKVRACAKGFRKQNIDLDAFVSRQAAADLEDLRVLLGYDQWDIVGVSSGSSLAFAVMRDFPASVRSVVHDSPYPFGIDSFAANVSKHLDKLTQLFAVCKADAACNARFPALREQLVAAVEALDKVPLEHNGKRIDGRELLRRVTVGLQEAPVLPLIPAIIDAAVRRDGARLAQLQPASSLSGAVAGVPPEKIYVVGTWLSVECAERLPLFRREDTATAEPWPASLRRYMRVEWGAQDRAACAAWGYTPEPRIIDRPVTANIPTLVMLGAFDPQTPPDWGARGIADLPEGAGRVLVVPAAGHAVTTLPCPQALIGQFMLAPRAPLDEACLGQMRLQFLTD